MERRGRASGCEGHTTSPKVTFRSCRLVTAPPDARTSTAARLAQSAPGPPVAVMLRVAGEWRCLPFLGFADPILTPGCRLRRRCWSRSPITDAADLPRRDTIQVEPNPRAFTLANSHPRAAALGADRPITGLPTEQERQLEARLSCNATARHAASARVNHCKNTL
jgi:hypothetical protein